MPEIEKAKYPSYEGIDLNSVKLQPKWIFPLIRAEDFDRFCEGRNIPSESRYQSFYCSGGRPGLALEILGEVSHSLSLKRYIGSCVERTVLIELLKCTHTFNNSEYRDDQQLTFESSEIDQFDLAAKDNTFKLRAQLLVPIGLSILYNAVQSHEFSENDLNECLFRLADEGCIVTETNFGIETVSIANLALYDQLFHIHSSLDHSMTWKEAAAIKM